MTRAAAVISPHRAGTGMASAPFAIRVMAARRGRWRRTMGGYQVSGHGPGDDGYDEEGYDESQRAEILETTRTGPSDGTIMVELAPDLGGDGDRKSTRMNYST